MALLLTATLTVAVVAACGDDSSDLPPPPATPPGTGAATPGLDLTAEEEEAVAEAQATFDDFMTAYIEVAATNEIQETAAGGILGGRALEYLASPLREEVQLELTENWRSERTRSGDLTWEFTEAVSVELAADSQAGSSITAIFCIDATDWTVIDTASGEVSEQAGQRQLTTYRLVHRQHGTDVTPSWRVSERTETGQPC